MSTTIPHFSQVCLAPDNANFAVYLVGVPGAPLGRLEAYYVSVANINSPDISFVGNRTDVTAWRSNAQKACFTYPEKVLANSPVMIIQFEPDITCMSRILVNGTIEVPAFFQGISYPSRRLFARVGSVGSIDMFTAFTDFTTWSNASWTSFLIDFSGDIFSPRANNSPLTYLTSAPLLNLGTASDNSSNGYSIVFDTNGQGIAYPTMGFSDPNQGARLGSSLKVNMNSINLTKDAIPVTMARTGYILDKAPDGSTVIYSITPDESLVLQRVSNNNAVAPLFSAAMAATALNTQIVTYTPFTDGTPTFNSFDTLTGKWNGRGLISPHPVPSSKTPMGAIIAGVLGGLVVIAIVAFGIRCSRRGYRQAGGGCRLHWFTGDSGKVDESHQNNIPLDEARQHTDSYIPPSPSQRINSLLEAYQPMSYESNAIESIPYVRSPEYLSPTSCRELTVAGSNPQYVDPTTLITMHSGNASSPQYISRNQSPQPMHLNFNTPGNPQYSQSSSLE